MRTKKMASSLIIFILLTPILISGQSARKFYKAGDKFIGSKNYSDAIAQYSKAIEMDPDFTKAYLARANTYEILGKDNDATDDYKRAIVFMPKDSDVHYQAGRLLNKLGKYDEALPILNIATKLSKKNIKAYQEKVTTLIALENYELALKVADTAISLKKSALNYYNHGLVCEKLENPVQAKADFTQAIRANPNFVEPYLSRAALEMNLNKLDNAMNDCSRVLSKDEKNTKAYFIRSQIYIKRLEYPNAINDISRIILIRPDDTEMYIVRGTYYQEFNQHTNAINDFSKAITLNSENPESYFLRAKSYEEILDYKKAAKDYSTITALSEYDGKAMKLKDEAEERLFEINRESDNPVILFLDPVTTEPGSLKLPLGKEEVLIKGKVEEQNNLHSLFVNDKEVHFEKKGEHFEFVTSVDVKGIDKITIVGIDVYENKGVKEIQIVRTEINNPVIQIMAPYASDNGEIYLNENEPSLYVEGKIEDESLMKSIMIEGILASYRPDAPNPTFSATISIMNKNKFAVQAEDIYGNITIQTFYLNREGLITQDNPMGKTWVVFIDNSNYETFASLEGPTKDISIMQGALANYQINNILVKKDMTKEQLEKFFSIELRDLVRSNQVYSLMVWYAGHGKFINETGYWIPVDAKRDDEFTYFNINTLKASLQTYSKWVTHTLVVTDACESGPTFYQAMRSVSEERSCDDWRATRFKSSQVFSSAGYELAVDNSQFTRTFVNALANNPNACIPIENIVSQVTIAVSQNNQQRPQFGKISGMEDENGTFFFIAK